MRVGVRGDDPRGAAAWAAPLRARWAGAADRPPDGVGGGHRRGHGRGAGLRVAGRALRRLGAVDADVLRLPRHRRRGVLGGSDADLRLGAGRGLSERGGAFRLRDAGFRGRGGGAGGNPGIRVSSGTMPSISPIPGGQGSNGSGESSTVGAVRGTVRAGGTGGKGAENIDGAGLGGRGASVNGLSITESNIMTLSADDIAQYIAGGNGSNGTAPASRPSMTGVAGGKGGGGGGAWTSGQNGVNPTSPGRGINGQGGAGGVGGTGAVWLLKIEQLRKAQEKVR